MIGDQYKWGAPIDKTLQQIAYDCSSLVASIFGNLGVNLPRTSEQQANAVTPVTAPQIGDLVFGSFKSLNDHVGIYVGNNMVVSAWDEAHGVIENSINWPGVHFGRVNG
jgi:cell wall-associated NlpC family hydrolase